MRPRAGAFRRFQIPGEPILPRVFTVRHIAAALLALAAATMAAPAAAQSLADLVSSAQAARVAPNGDAGLPPGAAAIFGSREFKAGSLQGLPQWQRVLAKMKQQRAGYLRCSEDASACQSEAQRAWREVVQLAAKGAPRDRLKIVNQYFNRLPYRLDSAVYGVNEYWATPDEFLRLSGDCEDYAIAKFFALRQLGYDAEALRIVILWDEIRGIGHAVLAVYQPQGIVILDNLSELIVSHERYKHYIPQYSMNETTRWAHVHAKKIPTLVAQKR